MKIARNICISREAHDEMTIDQKRVVLPPRAEVLDGSEIELRKTDRAGRAERGSGLSSRSAGGGSIRSTIYPPVRFHGRWISRQRSRLASDHGANDCTQNAPPGMTPISTAATDGMS